MAEKRKKEKITYIDDGRTLADMSNVADSGFTRRSDESRPPIRFGDAWHTFWDSLKMMLLPAAVLIGGMGALYFLMWLALKFLAK